MNINYSNILTTRKSQKRFTGPNFTIVNIECLWDQETIAFRRCYQVWCKFWGVLPYWPWEILRKEQQSGTGPCCRNRQRGRARLVKTRSPSISSVHNPRGTQTRNQLPNCPQRQKIPKVIYRRTWKDIRSDRKKDRNITLNTKSAHVMTTLSPLKINFKKRQKKGKRR